MTRLGVAGLAIAALALTACGSSSSGGTPPAGGQTVNAGATPNANGCTPETKLVTKIEHFPGAPAMVITPTTYTARIVTNCGTIVVSLDGKDAPKTVNSFFVLAGHGYFNDTPCHRLTTSGIYVLQCGDPTGTGTGGPGYTIPDENLKGATYPTGTLAMANTGRPHTGGSQFFFVYKDTDLPPQYTPFGTVTGGLDVLNRIAAAGSTPTGDGAPTQPVAIESFSITKG